MRFLRFRVRQIPRSARRSTNSGWCPADRITEFETDDVVNSPQFRIGFNGGRLARVLPRNHLAPAPCRGFETVGTSTNHIRGPPTRNPARKHLLKTRAVWSFSRQYSKHKKTLPADTPPTESVCPCCRPTACREVEHLFIPHVPNISIRSDQCSSSPDATEKILVTVFLAGQ